MVFMLQVMSTEKLMNCNQALDLPKYFQFFACVRIPYDRFRVVRCCYQQGTIWWEITAAYVVIVSLEFVQLCIRRHIPEIYLQQTQQVNKRK